MSNIQASDIDGKFGSDSLLANAPFNATIFDGDDFFERKVALSFLPESSMTDSGWSAEISWDINNKYTVAIMMWR